LQTEQFMLPMNRETMTRKIAEYFKTQHFSLFTLSGMYEDLKDLLGCEVDLITDGGLMSFARESADRDKILIYERAA